MTDDPQSAIAFYSALFGWQADVQSPEEYGGYVLLSAGGRVVAGCGAKSADFPAPNAWTVYLQVEDVQAVLDAAVGSGAQPLLPVMQVGTRGSMAVLADPTGAVVGLWQPGDFAGFEAQGEPDAPVWFELTAMQEYDEAVRFYRDVFGWRTGTLETGDATFRYTTAGGPGEDGSAYAGIFDGAPHLPAEVPSYWGVYIGVESVDAATDRVRDLGGTVLKEPWTSEYGRMVVVQDPTGGVISLNEEV